MSKLPMKRIFICGLKKDNKKITDLLQRTGVVEISALNPKEYDLQSFGSKITQDKNMYDKYVKLCDDTIELLGKYKTEKKGGLLDSLEGPKVISVDEFDKKSETVKDTISLVEKAVDVSKEISELKASIPKKEMKIEQYVPWKNLDISLNLEKTSKTKIFIGSFKNEVSMDMLYEQIYAGLTEEQFKFVDVSILSSDKEQTCVMVVALNEIADKVNEQLKKMDFAKAPISKEIPSEEINNIKKDIENTLNLIKQKENLLVEYAKSIDDIKFARDYYILKSDVYDNLVKIPTSENAFFIQGYVPTMCAGNIVQKINNSVEAYVELSDLADGEKAPVILKNGFFASPMETVVESYSMPSNNEIDPSKILAIFYYMLFGLMLSDAGYGLLLFLGTGILLLKVKNMKTEMKKMLKLFCFGGFWTIIWGILFGSVFGNAVDVIAWYIRGDMNAKVTPVLVPFLRDTLHVYWFNPVEEPMRLLVFAFCIGIVHLMTGLLIKGYLCIKQHDIKGLIYDVVFWIMFVGGGIAYLLTMDMVTGMIGLSEPIGEPLPTIAGIIMGLGCLGVILTSGRESKNWFKRLLKGAYGAYGITGWLSDVLSYSRLLALGLATGIIAEVFNTMGSMIKVPFVGLIVFIIVFVVGHVLNLGINVLGAYVHTNRLQFVEFFSKFYEGGGEKFTPLTENTKYYFIEEEK